MREGCEHARCAYLVQGVRPSPGPAWSTCQGDWRRRCSMRCGMGEGSVGALSLSTVMQGQLSRRRFSLICRQAGMWQGGEVAKCILLAPCDSSACCSACCLACVCQVGWQLVGGPRSISEEDGGAIPHGTPSELPWTEPSPRPSRNGSSAKAAPWMSRDGCRKGWARGAVGCRYASMAPGSGGMCALLTAALGRSRRLRAAGFVSGVGPLRGSVHHATCRPLVPPSFCNASPLLLVLGQVSMPPVGRAGQDLSALGVTSASAACRVKRCPRGGNAPEAAVCKPASLPCSREWPSRAPGGG
jgi:hypothetical protein